MASPTSYDVVLTLRLHSLTSITEYRHLIAEAASSTRSKLLILLPTTQLWTSLLQNRAESFEQVQTFLSQVYVLAQSKFKEEDASVDVVVEALRGTGNGDTASLQHLMKDAKKREYRNIAQDNGSDGPDGAKMHEEGMGTVALGGTFDHLHPGHKILLTMACWLAQRRTIVGITDDILLKGKSDRDLLESLETRTKHVRNFLNLICPTLQHDTPALQDVYGPTATDPDVQGVLVSEETRKGAASIAEKRKQDNLSTLRLFVIKVISPEDILDPNTVSKEELVSAKIGSTQIRRRLRERLDKR